MRHQPHPKRARPRRRRIAALLTGALAAGLLGGPALAGPPPDTPVPKLALPSPPGGEDVRVLVFHGATGEESPTVDAAIEAIETIGRQGPAQEQFTIRATDDPAVFTNAKRLGRFNAVVFLTGDGDVLDPEQEAGLESFMEAGGGFLGIHDAARAEPYSDWFTGLIGARPAEHSPAKAQRAVVEVGDRQHPATKELPVEWKRLDKWLNWEKNPSGAVHTVARVRTNSYEPGPDAGGCGLG